MESLAQKPKHNKKWKNHHSGCWKRDKPEKSNPGEELKD
jgi:hypothetical protein